MPRLIDQQTQMNITEPPAHAVKHVIEIKEWFDQSSQRWKAKITMQEWRQGQQYGGAVVHYATGTRRTTPDSWRRRVVRIVIKRFLSLMTYQIK